MEEGFKTKKMNTHTDTNNPYWIVTKEDGTFIDKGKIKKGQNVSTKHLIKTFKNKQKWLEALEDFNIDTSEL